MRLEDVSDEQLINEVRNRGYTIQNGEIVMSKQPEALRLAEALETGRYLLSVERDATAAELRRLHEENERLRGAITELLESARAPGGGNRGHISRPATREHEARVEKAWLDLEATLRREGTT